MRYFIVILVTALINLAPAGTPLATATPSHIDEHTSLEATVAWINNYRIRRDLHGVPGAVRALSRFGAFKEPEAAGIYIGFIAGIIGSNPAKAEALIARMFPLAAEDHWIIVRAIAYSGSPRWKELLHKFAARMPGRAVMIATYLDGKLPTLDALTVRPAPTTMEKLRDDISSPLSGKKKPKKIMLEPSQAVLDTLWGYYLGSGSYGPIFRIIEMLPMSKDRNNTERLTVGSMAKYTLATNAARDPVLLSMLKSARKAREQPKQIVATLDEVITAAETAETGRIRKDALAAIEELKIKGPAYKRQVSTWAKVGQGALAVGCIVAATTGHVELGLPCVLGGGLTSAALFYWNGQ